MVRIIINKHFDDRFKLDDYVTLRFGRDPEKNKEHVMEMTDDEMKKCMLSEEDKIFGIAIRKLEP